MSASANQSDDAMLRDILAPVYIVVMCCGLAGAIVLFLVFATMPHAGQIPSRQRSIIPTLGSDAVNSGSGAHLDERAHVGSLDLMRIRLELSTGQFTAQFRDDAIAFPEMSSLRAMRDASTMRSADTICFQSPLALQQRQMRPIRILLRNLPRGTKCSGKLVIIAGAFSSEIRVRLTAPTDRDLSDLSLGTVNVNDKHGPSSWFVPAIQPYLEVLK
jgi:hypothetical protein